MNEQTLNLIDKLCNYYIDIGVAPGIAIAIVEGGNVLMKNVYGIQSTLNKKPLNYDTLFQMASVSKFITAHVLAKFTNEWETKIKSIWPDFTLDNQTLSSMITLKDCLSHRSGIVNDHSGDVQENFGYDLVDIINFMKYTKTDVDYFRNIFKYQNYMFTLGTYAILDKLGVSIFDAYDNFFNLLEMFDSTINQQVFIDSDNVALPHVLAPLHFPMENEGDYYKYVYEKCHKFGPNQKYWNPLLLTKTGNQIPSGGVICSLNDLTNFLLFLLDENQDIISTDNIQKIRTPAISISQTVSYGLGCFISADTYSHTGVFAEGIDTAININPNKNFGFVILVNCFPSPISSILTNVILGLTDIDKVVVPYWSQICSLINYIQKPSGVSVSDHIQINKKFYNNFYGEISINGDYISLGKLAAIPILWTDYSSGKFMVKTLDNNNLTGFFSLDGDILTTKIGNIDIHYSSNKINNIIDDQEKSINHSLPY